MAQACVWQVWLCSERMRLSGIIKTSSPTYASARQVTNAEPLLRVWRKGRHGISIGISAVTSDRTDNKVESPPTAQEWGTGNSTKSKGSARDGNAFIGL
jgi:hypothetical protein